MEYLYGLLYDLVKSKKREGKSSQCMITKKYFCVLREEPFCW